MIFGRRKIVRSGRPEWDGQPFEVLEPRVPEEIRRRAQAMAQPDWKLYFNDTDEGGEWWLLDDDGELVEAFWLEE